MLKQRKVIATQQMTASPIQNLRFCSCLSEYILIYQDLLTTSSVLLVFLPCLARARIPVTFTGQYTHFSLRPHQFSFTTTSSQIPFEFSVWVVETTYPMKRPHDPTMFPGVTIHLSPQSHVPLCLMMVAGLHSAFTTVLWKLLILLSLAP